MNDLVGKCLTHEHDSITNLKTWLINVIKVKDCGNQLKYYEFNAWLVTLGIGTKATIICWDLSKYIHILLIFMKV